MTARSAGQMATRVAEAGDASARRLLTVLLRRYGIPVAETVTADGADSAVEAAWWLGFPVTLVAEGGWLTDRPEITRCGLATPTQVRVAYRQLATSIGPAMTGVRLRRQPQHGAEVIVRVTRVAETAATETAADGTAGESAAARTGGAAADAGQMGAARGHGTKTRRPGTRDADRTALVSLELGGPAAALVGAQVTRRAPITAHDARDMLSELRGSALPADADVAGLPAAGRTSATAETPSLDLAALADLLERVGRLAACIPQLAELELDPVVVTSCGVAVAGVHGRFSRTRRADGKARKVRSLRPAS